ncbi:MAG: OmpA family protein [Bacteroidetes bacterium]|nr:OmpA family protein [Bacteroidota bacterium]
MKRSVFLLIAIFYCLLTHSQQGTLIKSIYFGGGSAYIDGGQALELKEFIESIPNLENYQISISSHTDNIGGKEYNQWLSEMRSESTIQQLNLNDIPRERIGRIDNGQDNPLYDNRTHHGRMANRRVDIIFTPLFL